MISETKRKKVWLCPEDGKVESDRYKFKDASCYLACIEVYEDTIEVKDGVAVKVPEDAIVNHTKEQFEKYYD
jgi:hypothetical protein